jgi:hypothetical protein
MGDAAHLAAWNALTALNIPDLVKNIGNRLQTQGVLKQTAIQWPTRAADVEAMVIGDLQDLLQASTVNWVQAPAILIPGAAPVDAALVAWWTTHGRLLTSRFAAVLRRDLDETHEEIKEMRALPKEERERAMESPVWRRFAEQVTNVEDFTAAKAEIDGPGEVQLKLTRAINLFKDGVTPKPAAGDNLGHQFYFIAQKYHALQERELEREWRALNPEDRPIKSFGATVRKLLTALTDVKENFIEAMAAACSTSEAKVSAKDLQDLAQISSPAFQTTLEFVMRAYPIIFGSQPGARPAGAIKRLMDKWMRHDPSF